MPKVRFDSTTKRDLLRLAKDVRFQLNSDISDAVDALVDLHNKGTVVDKMLFELHDGADPMRRSEILDELRDLQEGELERDH